MHRRPQPFSDLDIENCSTRIDDLITRDQLVTLDHAMRGNGTKDHVTAATQAAANEGRLAALVHPNYEPNAGLVEYDIFWFAHHIRCNSTKWRAMREAIAAPHTGRPTPGAQGAIAAGPDPTSVMAYPLVYDCSSLIRISRLLLALTESNILLMPSHNSVHVACEAGHLPAS